MFTVKVCFADRFDSRSDDAFFPTGFKEHRLSPRFDVSVSHMCGQRIGQPLSGTFLETADQRHLFPGVIIFRPAACVRCYSSEGFTHFEQPLTPDNLGGHVLMEGP